MRLRLFTRPPQLNVALLVCLAIIASNCNQHAVAIEPGDPPIEAFDAEAVYTDTIQPLLVEYCYDCHGYGEKEGDLSLEQFAKPADAVSDPELWWRVMKNLRAGVMPPPDWPKPSDDEERAIVNWIKFGPFAIDRDRPDPGPITVRRLNRQEYGNTIRALMGVSFDEKLIFPPDDSGHGFDNVADALMVSPMLLDKYLQAAQIVVARAVPDRTWIVPRQQIDGSEFKSQQSGQSGNWLDGKKPVTVSRTVNVKETGTYRITIETRQHGSFEFDPARYRVTCRIDGEERFSAELGWDENKRTEHHYDEAWDAGEHSISFQLRPVDRKPDGEVTLEDNSGTHVSFEIDSVTIEGPEGTERRVHPRNYERFFTRDSPPDDPGERRLYAAEVLRPFARRAFRGRVDDVTIDRAVAIAEDAYGQPDVTFEAGLARAMVAILVSPRFLFRIESVQPTDGELPYAPVDELSLASRLSYFLWSTMPDEELFKLAESGRLRAQLPQQIERMLADPRSDAFIANFVGQWLRTRDVVQTGVDPAVVLGFSEELEELREWFRSRFRRRGRPDEERSEADQKKIDRYREIRAITDRFDDDLKRSMQRETEMFVEHVLRSNTSLLDLLDCDYTFLNEKLAEHYGIEGVEGREMRRVELAEDSPRGGVLTQASMLVVTSNPTRTSPVKRGLFILDNILGTPAPPAPAAVPELEESAEHFKGRTPSLRELLAFHRDHDLCASCHARMDPLGLALENFDALGMWRDVDQGNPIEPQGELVTGDAFDDIRSLKKLLREKYAEDFYRCVSEKMLVYAIGRGIQYSDEHTLDVIVERLKANDGRFSVLVQAIIESAPFQMQRVSDVQLPPADDPSEAVSPKVGSDQAVFKQTTYPFDFKLTAARPPASTPFEFHALVPESFASHRGER